MDEMIEVIRAAVADGATPDAKARGAAACRTIGAALGAEPGKPLSVPGAPAPSPLAGVDPGLLVDALIARLTALAEKKATAPSVPPPSVPPPSAPPPGAPAIVAPRGGLRIAFVAPPPIRRATRTAPRRKL